MSNYPYKYWRLCINNLYGKLGSDFEESISIDIHSAEKESLFVKAKQLLALDPFKDEHWNINMAICEMDREKMDVLQVWIWDHNKQEFVEDCNNVS